MLIPYFHNKWASCSEMGLQDYVAYFSMTRWYHNDATEAARKLYQADRINPLWFFIFSFFLFLFLLLPFTVVFAATPGLWLGSVVPVPVIIPNRLVRTRPWSAPDIVLPPASLMHT